MISIMKPCLHYLDVMLPACCILKTLQAKTPLVMHLASALPAGIGADLAEAGVHHPAVPAHCLRDGHKRRACWALCHSNAAPACTVQDCACRRDAVRTLLSMPCRCGC